PVQVQDRTGLGELLLADQPVPPGSGGRASSNSPTGGPVSSHRRYSTRAEIRPVRRSASSTTNSVGRASRFVAAPSGRWSSATPASPPPTTICPPPSRPSRVLPDPPPPITSSTGVPGGPWHQPVI